MSCYPETIIVRFDTIYVPYGGVEETTSHDTFTLRREMFTKRHWAMLSSCGKECELLSLPSGVLQRLLINLIYNSSLDTMNCTVVPDVVIRFNFEDEGEISNDSFEVSALLDHINHVLKIPVLVL